MNLSNSSVSLSANEESMYKSIYNKIAMNTPLTKGTCVKLMVKRGGIAPEIAQKVPKIL